MRISLRCAAAGVAAMLVTFLMLRAPAHAVPDAAAPAVVAQPSCGGYSTPCPTTPPPTRPPATTKPPTASPSASTPPPGTCTPGVPCTPPAGRCVPGEESCLPQTGDRILLLYGAGVSLVVIGALIFTLAWRRRPHED